uniref:Uncharacterized protein n=1 Tax=Vespula pensylvanica TaxID=30213 RepID=A0A834U978_VESPE|nr:hypothetical protein H0235_008572 [Vespula pensylvanica]
MAKIYFLAFLALLVFIAVSAQEEQDKEFVLDVQYENAKEYRWPCSTGGDSLCRQYCWNKGKRFGSCIATGHCLCFI